MKKKVLKLKDITVGDSLTVNRIARSLRINPAALPNWEFKRSIKQGALVMEHLSKEKTRAFKEGRR